MKLKPKSAYFVSAAIACLALSQQLNAADEAAAKAPSQFDLAKQLSNSIANLISWPTRLDGDTDIGPTPALPTGDDGLTLVLLKQDGPWAFGFPGNQLWDVSSDDDAEDISSTFLQPLKL